MSDYAFRIRQHIVTIETLKTEGFYVKQSTHEGKPVAYWIMYHKVADIVGGFLSEREAWREAAWHWNVAHYGDYHSEIEIIESPAE